MTAENTPTPDAELQAAIRRAVDLVLPNYLTPRTAAVAGFRLSCLAWLMDAPSLRGVTQTTLAQRLGVTKAGVSKCVVALSKATGHHRGGMKPRTASPHYSAAAREGWTARRQNDHYVVRARTAVATYYPAAAWLDTLPKHNQRRALVLIGSLPSAGAMRAVVARLVRRGWPGASHLRRWVERTRKRHTPGVIETGGGIPGGHGRNSVEMDKNSHLEGHPSD